MENAWGLSVVPQPEKELYNEINSWLKNLEKWLLNSIDTAINESSINQLSSETKGYIQKAFSEIFLITSRNFSKK